jgi:tyrosine-protein kinase Etk/Wzc
MSQPNPQFSTQEDSDLLRALNLFTRNYKLLAICISIALVLAFIFNRLSIPVYQITASLLIQEENKNQLGNAEEYINQDLFGSNQGFQNELYVLKSSPVLEQTIKNLDLTVNYFQKDRFRLLDAYKIVPFRILLLKEHIQPINVNFRIAFYNNGKFTIKAEEKTAVFTHLYTGTNSYIKNDWSFVKSGKFGDLIETPDMAFIIEKDSTTGTFLRDDFVYGFVFSTVPATIGRLKGSFNFLVADRDATVVQIDFRSTSYLKGLAIVNEIMDVYSIQNVNRKNHIADVTIDYIERQLGEISDSLSQTEDNLQQFRSSRQLLDVNDKASGISEQYMNLQNQMAELVTRKRYYDYLAEHLSGNDISNIIVPTSMGVQDELLNTLVSELIAAQTQRSNLIRNHQERNPMVQRLEIQIENGKKAIQENITAVQKTTDIAIDEMDKRITRIQTEISRLPKTQRQLGGIERTYRLNDAIYNYLLEKRAEAKISQASKMPDNIIIEPASLAGVVSPNTRKNYLFALVLGLMLPYAFLFLRSMINDKIDYQEPINHLTDAPLVGKIPHTRKKSNNAVFDYPKSVLAEAYRALRTNIEYRYRDRPHKIMLVTSSIEGEGKSFNALNLAMVYAQLGRHTILVDFDLRKPTGYFNHKEILPVGLSSYFIDRVNLCEIIQKSPHSKLDYIPSGPIPPNPVEMMASEEIRDLINQLGDHYDCIILDTTPLAQVADAYLLMDYADVKIVIARYNHTLKKIFHLVMNDLKQKDIDNLCVVLNDNRVGRNQYGYGYGYDNKKNN